MNPDSTPIYRSNALAVAVQQGQVEEDMEGSYPRLPYGVVETPSSAMAGVDSLYASKRSSVAS